MKKIQQNNGNEIKLYQISESKSSFLNIYILNISKIYK